MLAFRILGPVELAVDGEAQRLPAKPRALLTLLLLQRNQVVALDRIVEDLWEGDPPETATKAAQIYVSQLRKVLGERLESRAPGYRLRIEPGEVDADRLEELLDEAERAPAERALSLLEEALGLWRGAALAEFAGVAFARDEAGRLEERRLEAQERRSEAHIALGRYPAAIAELERSVREQPLRERPHELLMLALYRAGRQADALEVYRRLRERLDDELGLTPSPALRELETAILRQDPELAAPRRPAREHPPAGELRQRQRRWLLVFLALVLAGAAWGIFRAIHRSPEQAPQPAMMPFVLKLENFLSQSSQGRKQVVALVRDVRACKVPPRRALRRLDLVERNRQSLLDQLAALAVPDDGEALASSDLLQKAIQAAIASDLAYRGWLDAARGCPQEPPPTTQADFRATVAKAAFTRVFNPLALRHGADAWDPHRF